MWIKNYDRAQKGDLTKISLDFEVRNPAMIRSESLLERNHVSFSYKAEENRNGARGDASRLKSPLLFQQN